MESLIADLKEQVSCLSTYLEEERLRHGGTKKRACVDLDQLEKRLHDKHCNEIDNIRQRHETEKLEIMSKNDRNSKELEAQLNKRYEKLQGEFRMLQASFKNYRGSVQEEMQEQWRLKKEDMDWERRRAVENAIDDNRRSLEEKFSAERDEMRKEFRSNVDEIIRDHREELETMWSKFTDGSLNIEELKKRSNQLDDVLAELEQVKERLTEEKVRSRRISTDLEDTRMRLRNLELQFDEKVAAVEESHRSMIDSLKLERSDIKLQLTRSFEALHSERISREILEKAWKEAAVKHLETKIEKASGVNQASRTVQLTTTSGAKQEITSEVTSKEEEDSTEENGEIEGGSRQDVTSSQKRTRVSTAPTTRHPMYFNSQPLSSQDREELNSPLTATASFSGKNEIPVSQETELPQPERPDSPDVIH
ncbi:unnamed protein product [Clavelina lepadiformis]